MIHWSMVLLVTILVVKMVVTFMLNVISVVTITKSRSLRSRFPNILIVLLFSSHALSNMAYMTVLWALFFGSKNLALKTATLNTRDLCVGLTICFSTLLSTVRFISVYKPFVYENLTKKHAILTVLGSLSLLVIFSVWRLFSTLAYLFAILYANISGITILICNIYLYRLVKRQCKDIAATFVSSTQEEQSRQRNLTKKRSMRALKMCIWITASYFLTIVPGVVMLFISRVFQPDKFADDYSKFFKNPDTRDYLDSVNSMIAISNGIWDVIIFYKFNS
eukprot:TCONS_00027732-protein